MESLRSAARLLRRQAAFAAVVIVTLGLGIGATTALYSVLQAVLLRPFPFADPDRLVVMWQTDLRRNQPFIEVSYPDYLDWRDRTSALDSTAAMLPLDAGATLTGSGDPRQLQMRPVSASFFDVLGTGPFLGRTFVPADEARSANVVVLSHRLWRTQFSADPSMVGRAIALDGEPHTIVGIMPASFTYPESTDLWTPIEAAVPDEAIQSRNVRWLIVIARLRDATIDQARAEMNATIRHLAETYYPAEAESLRAVVRPLVGEIIGTTRSALLALMAAVGAVLAIACVNVTNLLLARGLDRRREISTRLALGASRGRLAAQLLAEVLPLAIGGGLLGILLAWWSLTFITKVAGSSLPRAEGIAVDAGVLAVALAISCSSGVLCALAPLLQSRRIDLGVALRGVRDAGDGAPQQRIRRALVVTEIALAVALVAGAALAVRSFLALRSSDLGFDPRGVLVAEVPLTGPKYATVQQARIYHAQLIERLNALPQVEHASAIFLRPLWSAIGFDGRYVVEGQPPERVKTNPLVNVEGAAPGYFQTMRIALLEGREFTSADDERARGVVIVSDGFARRSWPGQSAIGRRIRIPGGSERFDREWLTVVGVVADVRYREIVGARLDVYQPLGQFNSILKHIVVRASGDPVAIAGAVREAARQVDPSQPVVDLRTMEDVVSTAMGSWKLNARLFGALGVLALTLAAVGIYSVMTYAISRRTREIGVRVALGAGRGEIVTMVIGEGARLAVAGVLIGGAATLAVTGLMRDLLIDVHPRDPLTLAGAAAGLLVAAIAACALPARRAASIDPMAAMRTE